MKLPNLSKITKYITFPKFSIKIKTFLMLGLLIFYLGMIISDFSIKTFEYFTQKEKDELNVMANNISRQIYRVNDNTTRNINNKVNSISNKLNTNYIHTNAVMRKLIPDIQKNIIDLSYNLHSIEPKIAEIQPSIIENKNDNLNITPIPK
uniref:Uncharacterized protein n=1 Tax=viral metagenome TaxID=1070528 RepID=A0A6C0DL69_9ZZZZ